MEQTLQLFEKYSAILNYLGWRVKENNRLKLNKHEEINYGVLVPNDCLCGLVVGVPGYRYRGPGSIPGATVFLRSSGSGTGSTEPLEYN
jgi:hypothetical protein